MIKLTDQVQTRARGPSFRHKSRGKLPLLRPLFGRRRLLFRRGLRRGLHGLVRRCALLDRCFRGGSRLFRFLCLPCRSLLSGGSDFFSSPGRTCRCRSDDFCHRSCSYFRCGYSDLFWLATALGRRSRLGLRLRSLGNRCFSPAPLRGWRGRRRRRLIRLQKIYDLGT